MRMTRLLPAFCLLTVMGCAASSKWDPQAAESLKQEPVKILRDLDAGNFMTMIEQSDSNVVIMDFDENNAPIRLNGTGEARAFMTRMMDMAKTQGLKFTSTMVSNDAWATPTMGYCVVEYDQTISAGGQTMGPFKFRGTMIARREGNRWILTHWHGSFRETPPPMVVADTTAAAK